MAYNNIARISFRGSKWDSFSSNGSIDHLKRDFHFVLIHLVETMVVAANAHVINCYFFFACAAAAVVVFLSPMFIMVDLLKMFNDGDLNKISIYVCMNVYTYIEGGDRISRCKRFTWIRAELKLSEWIRESGDSSASCVLSVFGVVFICLWRSMCVFHFVYSVVAHIWSACFNVRDMCAEYAALCNITHFI